MSNDTHDTNAGKADEVDARQVDGAQLKQSKEEADETNPDVEHNEATDEHTSREEVESFEKWEKEEADPDRTYSPDK